MTLRTVALYLFLAVPVLSTSAQAPVPWTDIPAGKDLGVRGERRITPKKARILRLDVEAMRAQLSSAPLGSIWEVGSAGTVVVLPSPDGGKEAFLLMEVPVMHPDLQERFPGIRTYTGVGVEDAATTVKLDLTPHGFHAMVLRSDRTSWFIDPLVVGNDLYYQVYDKQDFQKEVPAGFRMCAYDEVNDLEREQQHSREWMGQMAAERVGDCQFRTYDLALACTGEYANFHGSNTTNNNKAFAAAAMVTSMNRVNAMFERDATLTMVLVANNDALIFLDPATDPYTNNSGTTMLGQNQTTCDATIGNANYDIGHVFSTGGGGVAALNSPCSTSNKARGVTGRGAPVGDPFDIDYVAHEMGHQYGGNHTQNNACNRASSAAVEVGSGITIMGYAGICAPDVASNSIAMFGGFSMQEMAANITVGTSSTCPSIQPSSNASPVVNAGVDRVIPRSTPFILTGSATDANGGNVLTYSWEQMDNAVATQPPVATNTGGPAFVPLLPQSTPVRYMPNLPAVIGNTTPTWEVLASVGRTYNFRLTVRDNVAGAGCSGQDNMVVTVNGASGPFLVTQPNTAVVWAGLSSQTITWDVAGTSAAPVSCAAVDILLSSDGGLTYPFTLLTGTPNDGSQTVTIPNQPSTTARIMVRANGNIFYDISNANFTINASAAPDYTLNVPGNSAIGCQPADASYTVEVGSILGYDAPVTLGQSGLPAGLSVSFSSNPVVPVGSSTLTITNTGAVAPGTYAFTLTASSASGPKTVPLTVSLVAPASQVTATSPADGATGITNNTPLNWVADPAASSYTVVLATNATMTAVVETVSGLTGTTFQPAIANAPLTTYYWTVRSVNACGTGVPSAVRSYTTAPCQNVTVKIVLDRYGAETTWRIQNAAGAIFASGGPYTTVGANGAYPQPDVSVCLPLGCYTLVVNDSFGDGLCCAYGVGAISVVDQNNIPLVPSASAFTTSVSSSFCVPAPCATALPYTENFDLGAGLWFQRVGDDMDWTRASGATPTANTGPNSDHTTGTGSYLYTESDAPNNPSKVAELYGPCFDLSGLGTAELRFWYHMNGATMGTLNVDVWNGTAWTNAIFTRSGEQGTNWVQATVDLSAFVGGTVRVRFRGVTGNGSTSDMAIDDIELSGAAPAAVQLQVDLWLEGPYDPVTDLMRDDLRAAGLVPTSEPYTSTGYVHVGGGGETTTAPLLAATGSDAIVDWVVIELRSAADPANVLATRSALLQCDGDVVSTDGASTLSFGVAPGNYHVAVRHRNHFGCMTATTRALSGAATTVDFRSASTAVFGTEARKPLDGVEVLWAGNALADDQLKYTGQDNDRDPVLTRIGGVVPTNIVAGYFPEDLNLDGEVKYSGVENDRDIVLVNIGGSVPTTVRTEQLP